MTLSFYCLEKGILETGKNTVQSFYEEKVLFPTKKKKNTEVVWKCKGNEKRKSYFRAEEKRSRTELKILQLKLARLGLITTNWYLAIWQNWCFGQFYHSKIEKSVSFSLVRGKVWEDWEDSFCIKFGPRWFYVDFWSKIYLIFTLYCQNSKTKLDIAINIFAH